MAKIPFVTFNNGLKCPIFGLGTWKSEPGKVKQAVISAIDIGYRHIDCAYIYQNEKEVGEALLEKLSQGTVKREDIFITSKLWNTFHRPDLVPGALKESLKNLSLEYLDLYLIHWPMAYKEEAGLVPKDSDGKILYSNSNVSITDTWKAMEKLVTDGLVKSIGLSNFNSKQVEEILKIATIKPVVNQVECHPYLNQRKLQQFCEQHAIKITAYSPLGSGDRPWAKSDDPVLLKDPKLEALAAKYGRTPAQILLRYQVERGNIVIPKSVSPERIHSNFNIFDFSLTNDDILELDGLNRNIRYCHHNWDTSDKEYPFFEEF